jgi:hypothetical protein
VAGRCGSAPQGSESTAIMVAGSTGAHGCPGMPTARETFSSNHRRNDLEPHAKVDDQAVDPGSVKATLPNRSDRSRGTGQVADASVAIGEQDHKISQDPGPGRDPSVTSVKPASRSP